MWKNKTKLSFKAAKALFSLHLKSPLLCLCRPNSTAKSARSCFLSWEDGTQTEADVEIGRGGGGADCRVSEGHFRRGRSLSGLAAAGW